MDQFVDKGHGVPIRFMAQAEVEPLRRLLARILRTLVRLPWLHADAGGIFLADGEDGSLELLTHINFPPRIQGTCKRITPGHCLCGRVAEIGELLHAGCVDHRHDITYPGMADHGHYVVPIKAGERLLGVLTLYVPAGHRACEEETETLRDFAATMAVVIQTMQLRRDKALMDMVVEQSSHGVMIADRAQRIQWVNPAFERTTGYRLEEIRGKTPRLLSSGRHDRPFYRRMWRAIQRHGQWQGEIWNRRKSGEIYPEWLNIVALRNARGEPERYAAMFVDLTEIRRAEEHIRRLAYFDSLTGLPNRNRFLEELSRLLSEQSGVIVLVLDLDCFHEVNDGLGHAVGDAMLRETARRLESLVADGLLARDNPDQFLIAVRPADREGLVEHCQALIDTIGHAFREDFGHGQQALNMSATLGAAIAAGDDAPGELLKRALQALRQAKRDSRGGYRVFDAELGRQSEFDNFVMLNVRHVVARGELDLAYQPQVDAHGRVVGAEVLVRWNSPERGAIPPDRFIPQAEESGAIVDIGRWVVEQGAAQLAAWRHGAMVSSDGFRLSINLSPAQMIGCDVSDGFAAICRQLDLPPSALEVEITETALVRGFGRIRSQLTALSDHGFHIAIDDFGTGYSSLSRLHAFPIDVFKIDRSFIDRMEEGSSHLAIVRAMIDMAHSLGYAVVAEGVETESQFNRLKALGCDRFQGYWLARPLSADDLAAFVQAH